MSLRLARLSALATLGAVKRKVTYMKVRRAPLQLPIFTFHVIARRGGCSGDIRQGTRWYSKSMIKNGFPGGRRSNAAVRR